MRIKRDLTGQRFGRLVAVRAAGRTKGRLTKWLCLCDCGQESVVVGGNLYKGLTRSCGCLHREVVTRHGMHGTPTYKSWECMIRRCIDPRHISYPYYGSRGIRVCERWRDFKLFLDDMGDRPEGTTIDRIDNDGNYEPGNCRWATALEQSGNRRPRGTSTSPLAASV